MALAQLDVGERGVLECRGLLEVAGGEGERARQDDVGSDRKRAGDNGAPKAQAARVGTQVGVKQGRPYQLGGNVPLGGPSSGAGGVQGLVGNS